ncbi:MAG TPA: CsgG/HfaB family protein [Gemmatimonadaceae bacterium]|nr:CsgG/HfaB family protein [Gemmatimonadaceae bacterium]
MRIARALRGLILLSAITACATGGRGGSGAGGDPAALERLEAEHRAAPRSAEVARALGIAYYRAGRHAEARATLAGAHRADPRDGTIALYLGMSAEHEGDLSAARLAYSTYLQHGRTRRVRRELEQRLVALTRAELRVNAREALEREGELASTPGSPNVIAVLPFRFSGSDSTLRPLERGVADLVVTDLSRIGTLRVVERSHVQALLDEIDLSASGRVDAAAAVRSGRLLQAGRLVQGAITQLPGDALRLDGAVVDVATAEARGAAGTDDDLDALFELQKRFTLSILDALGVQPTAEERSAIEQRPTRSVAAFLAYSAGLEADDEGRLDEANRQFGEALRLDPGFSMARDRQQDTQAAMAGTSSSTASIEQSLQGTPEGQITEAAARGSSRPDGDRRRGTLATIASDLNPSAGVEATRSSTTASSRDPASATTGSDRITTESATVIIIVRQPTP